MVMITAPSESHDCLHSLDGADHVLLVETTSGLPSRPPRILVHVLQLLDASSQAEI